VIPAQAGIQVKQRQSGCPTKTLGHDALKEASVFYPGMTSLMKSGFFNNLLKLNSALKKHKRARL
ncbi:MAG: hypothetical protein M0Z61_17760, partial [Nitrospiraceae bacterium]|nr:hypothetical protein [Nitrospiraceae bacterium]